MVWLGRQGRAYVVPCILFCGWFHQRPGAYVRVFSDGFGVLGRDAEEAMARRVVIAGCSLLLAQAATGFLTPSMPSR